MNNAVKGLVLAALVVVLVLVLRFYSFRESQTIAEQPVFTESSIQTNEPNLSELYQDENARDFLRTDITLEEIDAIEAEIVAADASQYEEEIAIIRNKFEAQTAVNDLFEGEEKAINGDQVIENLPLKENLTLKQIEEIIAEYYFDGTDETQNASLNFWQVSIVSAQEEASSADVAELDAFEQTINRLLDYVNNRIEQYQQAVDALKDVNAITIEDGQIGVIGQTMRNFEMLLEKVEEESYHTKLEEDATTYVDRFIDEISVLIAEIPGYYDLVLVALEPSELLTQALIANQDQFELASLEEEETTEIEVASSEEEVYLPPVYSEPEYSWSEPYYPPVSEPPYSEPPYSEPPASEPQYSEPPIDESPSEDLPETNTGE
ncbi:hypothetical protein [Fundicoccus culcitae]|uniref:MapZ extracellular domain-containing protein n=1 Tax=Fundicoccus culcitae TaxID=2969821 RepID=A0ABY5P2G8_9LACT|nr:hypothetical protein [Fundicoccus culcitae]UUX32912.1 hypothetical protein NRE15_08260 [Fundicoccus culcitae]